MADVTNIQQNLTPNNPELRDLLDLFRKEIFLGLCCHHIGTIDSFDETQQTASVTINYKKTYFQFDQDSGVYAPVLVDYPVLAQCPVICLGGGDAALTFPIKKGDECLILFNDRDLDNWFSGSSSSSNATGRLHAFSDGLILVGVRSTPNVLTSYDTTRAVLRNGDDGSTMVGVGPSKIKISNSSQDLKSLLQMLCSDVKDLISAISTNAASFILVTGPPGGPSPLNPAVVTSLTMVSSSLDTLSSNLGDLLE